MIDKDTEIKRLNKELEKKEKFAKSLSGKLNNPGFTSKAPEAVIEKEKARLAETESEIDNLRLQLEMLK